MTRHQFYCIWSIIIFNSLDLVSYQNLMQTTQTYTPKFKRRNTSNQFYCSCRHGQREERQRNKTHYNLQIPKKLQDQYADLTVESVKKNYLVGNLKPFSFDKSVFKQQKEQVEGLKEFSYLNTPQKTTFYDSKQPVTGKLNKILSSALGFNQSIKMRKNKKHRIKTQTFIESMIEDDHQNLIQDYRDQSKQQRMNRQKTIQQINNHIIQQYSSLIEKPSLVTPKNKIVKFKKSSKVARIYPASDNNYQYISKNYNEILKLEKSDYGIYSRSANRAIYYEKTNPTQKNDEAQNSSNAKITTKFYKNYMGSYSQRKNILRRSDASLKS